MTVNDVMTRDPACCSLETSLEDVAKMMVDCDCGEIPVVENRDGRQLVGVITDRDIVCRIVAKGKNPLQLTARECMSSPVTTVMPATSLDECLRVMEAHQIRRVPVVERSGACCGIISQADIASRTSEHKTAELVREVSRH